MIFIQLMAFSAIPQFCHQYLFLVITFETTQPNTRTDDVDNKTTISEYVQEMPQSWITNQPQLELPRQNFVEFRGIRPRMYIDDRL